MRVRYRVMFLALVLVALILAGCDGLAGGASVDQLETQNAQLRATIQMVGTPLLTIAALEQYATQNVVLQAQLNQVEIQALSAQGTLTVLQMGGGSFAQPTSPAIGVTPNTNPSVTTPPAALTPAPTTNPGAQTQFTQTVMANGRDQYDCPQGVMSVFPPATSAIYVITRVNVLKTGSTLGARWTVNGDVFYDDVECWIPDQDWYDICAYCSIVPDGDAFESGQWTVDLTLDGQTMAQARFVVGESDTSAQDAQSTPATGY